MGNSGYGCHGKVGVLFDMDGVIVLSNPAHLAAWQAFGRERLGVTITSEMFFQSVSGRKNEEALAELFPGRFSPAELKEASMEKEAFYRERFGPTLQPVPGVLRLIAELSKCRDVTIALATSGPPENVEFVLGRFEIKAAFQAVVNGSHVSRAKPDPAIYLLAAERLGIAPQGCIVLEDAFAGVQAAKRAGMRCLAVSTSEPEERLRQAGADCVYEDFTAVGLSDLVAL